MFNPYNAAQLASRRHQKRSLGRLEWAQEAEEVYSVSLSHGLSSEPGGVRSMAAAVHTVHDAP